MRAVIVGPGVMGELMGKAWREVLPEGELVFLGKEGERARFLAERYGGRAAYAVADAPGDWVFLHAKTPDGGSVMCTDFAAPPLQAGMPRRYRC
jgi:pyrroline-5-carboxylate reductase